MKCVLHIGTEKTGTTLLQDWLYSNQNALSNNGVYLSEMLDKNNNRSIVSRFRDELDDWARMNRIASIEEKNKFFETFDTDFAKEIESASKTHDVFVITSEHFHSRLCSKSEIEDLQKYLVANFDEVKIVCYFREQSQMARSLYSTVLKAASDRSLDEFLGGVKPSSYYYNFQDIAENWSEVFGKENCEFRIYDRELFVGKDIRQDFLSCFAAGVDKDVLDFTKTTSNESLSLLQGELFKVINEIVPFWHGGSEGVNHKNTQLKSIIRSIKCLNHGEISSGELGRVYEEFADINQKFISTYFDREYTFPKPLCNSMEEESKFSVEDLANMMTEVLRALLNNLLKGSFIDNDADLLRDIALKYETKDSLSLDDAIVLMKLAKKARPGGAIIASKLTEYQNMSAS